MSDLRERLAQMTPLQRAVFALKETQARLDALEERRNAPIAIIGMACRFPGGADDAGSYWRLLCDGVDAIREVPPDRWDVDAFYDPDPRAPGKMNTRWGGFLDRVDRFDNHFHGISNREATQIDPQHRLMLELAWEALEDAGLAPSRLRGSRTGVFVGLSHSEYGIMLSSDLSRTDAFVGTGTAHCIAANRVSFAFDWHGPSVTLDTACSSSLVSVHLACQAIRNGESEIALAGGVNVILSPLATVNLTKAGFSAADGRVRAFDAAASGYVRGEGAGLVVLKPLTAALKDGDPIYAVIRGSAVNQNGLSNGLTAPSRQAQEEALRAAYTAAKIPAHRIQYVETQGTGTALGDAIEAAALGHVLREGRADGSVCAIGSVKTNIGHLEAASGIASLMKVALALRHRQLPPTLHFRTPNPDIRFDELPLRVQQKLEPWPDTADTRIAGVSAFGFGGSNAHMVLEEPPEDEGTTPIVESGPATGAFVLPLSARTETALEEFTRRYVDFLHQEGPAWRDVCFAATTGRDHHDCRLAVIASSSAEAADALTAFAHGNRPRTVFHGRRPYGRDVKIAFTYDARIEPWQSAFRQLDRSTPRWIDAVAEVDASLQRVSSRALAEILDDASSGSDPARALPAIAAVQIVLTEWWRRAGVVPAVVLGRGAGELAAAFAAGVLSCDDALVLALAGDDEALQRRARSVEQGPATLPVLSASDGRVHSKLDPDPDRWAACLEHGDGLDATIAALGERQVDLCLEIGPAALCDALQQAFARREQAAVAVPCLGGAGDTERAIGTLYAAGVDFTSETIAPAGGRRVRLPTYPWQRQRLWAERGSWLDGAAAPAPRPDPGQGESSPVSEVTAGLKQLVAEQPEEAAVRSRPDLNTPFVAPRTDLERTLARAWSEILGVDPVGVHDNFFELGGDSLQAMILHNRLQDQLGEVVLGYVLFQVQTVDELAAYLRRHYPAAIRRAHPDEELDDSGPAPKLPAPTTVDDAEVTAVRRLVDRLAPLGPFPPHTASKNPRAVFVLSPPRSGSTLLRVMLAGHSGLFAPPELELLSFATMADRLASQADLPTHWLEGLVRTVMEVRGCGVEAAREEIRRCEESGTTTQEFYGRLQAALGTRVLVDKTPTYSGRLEFMERAEALFDEPAYVHLIRHPCAMIRSYVDYRMQESFLMRFKVDFEIPFTPEQVAELVWVISHENIRSMREKVPAERFHRLYFEDLVQRPEATMRSLCGFLNLDYQAEMIHPYDNRERKMLDGVVPEDRMYGDQKFIVKHKTIDPRVADAWREHRTGASLGPPARRIATEFGYDDLEPPADEKALGVDASSLVTAVSRDGEAEALLQRLDDLSDAEVLTLLQQHQAEEPLDG